MLCFFNSSMWAMDGLYSSLPKVDFMNKNSTVEKLIKNPLSCNKMFEFIQFKKKKLTILKNINFSALVSLTVDLVT